MKLPGINYNTPIQPLTLPSPSVAAAPALAAAKVAGDIANLSGQIYEGVQKEKANKALLDSYNNLNDFNIEAQTNPAAGDIESRYDDRTATIRTNVKENLSNYAFKQWEERFNVKSATVKNQILLSNALRMNKEQRQEGRRVVEETAFKGDLQSANEYVDNSVIFSEVEKKELYSKIGEDYAMGRVERATYSNDAALIKSELDDVRSDDYNGPLEGRYRNAAINQLASAFKLANQERAAAVQHERERFAGDLELNVVQGKAGPLEINRAFDRQDANGDNMITGPKRTQLLKLHDTLQNGRLKKNQDEQSFSLAMMGDDRLDPKNADHVLIVDEMFLRDPTPANGAEIAFKTNIMPTAMESNIRRFTLTGDPKMAIKYANAVEWLQTRAPHTLDNIGTKEMAVLKSTAAMVRSNVPISQAVQMARENAMKNPEEIKVIDEQYRVVQKDISSAERLSKRLNGSKFDQFGPFKYPTPTPAIQGAYNVLEREYFSFNGGDIEEASRAAFDNVQQIIGMVDLNGKKQLMAWAPNTVYRLPDDFLESDLNKFAKENKVEGIQIYSDSETAREKEKSYVVYGTDEFGNPKNTGLRWKPDITSYTKKRLSDAQAKWQELDDQRLAESQTLPIEMWGIGGL